MRDTLCNVEALKKKIDFNREEIIEEKEEINLLLNDIKEGIQRYPKKNEEIIYDTKVRLFCLLYEMIRAKFSLGMECENIEQNYLEMISFVSDIGCEKIGYVHFIQVFALGILLDVSNAQLEKLVQTADEEKLDDCLFDFLVHACGLTRKVSSIGYQKENPYQETAHIIDLSFKNKEVASKALKTYMEKKWFQGHYDYEWKNAHKRPGYVGIWSFETAALAKILGLDDREIQENNHYPYDLAHYKNERNFWVGEATEIQTREKPSQKAGLSENRALEQIIPTEFHELINQIILDYADLKDIDFWEKYKLNAVWYTVDEFSAENAGKKILGTIIVHILVVKGYILQLDYKENLQDYADDIQNYWGDEAVKMIRFELENDQNYYAMVPNTAYIEKIYEIAIFSVKI